MPTTNPSKVVVILLAAHLAACGLFADTADNQAKEFVKTLVIDPDNSAQLKTLSEGLLAQQPQDLLGNLSAKATVNYLRTKYRVGAKLRFGAQTAQKKGELEKMVVVTVQETEGDVAHKVKFNVDMHKTPDRGWCVSAVRTGG